MPIFCNFPGAFQGGSMNTPTEQGQDSRILTSASATFAASQSEKFQRCTNPPPALSSPLNSSHCAASPAVPNMPLKERHFDGRFTNYMKQYQPVYPSEVPQSSGSIVSSQDHQSPYTTHTKTQASNFNQLLSPSKLPHLSFNATTSSPLYLSQNHPQQTECADIHTTTDENADDVIDECPTDYSLRFQENEETELQRNLILEQMNDQKDHEVVADENDDEEQERNLRIYDAVKTYCTEGTPSYTPCIISHAGSVTDLQDNAALSSDEEENKPNMTPDSGAMVIKADVVYLIGEPDGQRYYQAPQQRTLASETNVWPTAPYCRSK